MEGINTVPSFSILKFMMLLILVPFLSLGGTVTSAKVFVTLSLINALRVPVLIFILEAVRYISEFSSVFPRLEVSVGLQHLIIFLVLLLLQILCLACFACAVLKVRLKFCFVVFD